MSGFDNGLRKSVVCLLWLVLGSATAVWAGRVTGTVTGADGAPQSDVSVRLLPEDESLPAVEVQTNARGKFAFGVLRPGEYRLMVLADGRRMAHIRANTATPDDRSAWSVDADVSPGSEPPTFQYSAITDVSYDVRLEPSTAGPGRFGTGSAMASTQQIVNEIQSGRLDAALSDLDEALAANPDNATLHYLKGFILRGRGEPEAAETAARRAVELAPGFEGGHLLLGKILEARGDLDGALASYEEERKVASSPQVQRDLYLALGEIYIRVDRLSDAKTALEKVVDIAPDTVAAYKELADVYLRLGEDARAKDMVAKLSELGESDPQVLFNMGAQRYNAGDMEQASEYFRQATEIDAGFADAYRQLGFARLKLGDEPGAIANLKKYLELNRRADDPEAEAARSVLSQLEGRP